MATVNINGKTVTLLSINCNGSQVYIIYVDSDGNLVREIINANESLEIIGTDYTA